MALNVAKFGGTSMANFDAMQNCTQIIIENPNTKIVVVSASSGVTNYLVALMEGNVERGEKDRILNEIANIQNKILDKLEVKQKVSEEIESLLNQLSRLVTAKEKFNLEEKDEILSFGERMSSLIFAQVLNELGRPTKVFDARTVVKTDSQFGEAKPNTAELEKEANDKILPIIKDYTIVTQGFIGSDSENKTTTLGRGGSDYTAALLAEALDAETCEIWTDVEGVYTTDPRIVAEAKLITELSFEEAAEMANFGAKVLHPATMIPALRSDVRVFVGSSFNAKSGGTWLVKDCAFEPHFRAISGRKDQVLLTINSPKMQFGVKFVHAVFSILSKYRWNIDLMTVSETAIAISIHADDWKREGAKVAAKIDEIADVVVEQNFTLITVVGNRLNAASGIVDRIFNALDAFSIRLICYGANPHNISFLVNSSESSDVIKKLHARLFE